MTAPVFGGERSRWTIGTQVRAHWWERDPADELGRSVEQFADGIVAGITKRKDADGGTYWGVRVSFGPVLDRVLPSEFRPEQIRPIDPGL